MPYKNIVTAAREKSRVKNPTKELITTDYNKTLIIVAMTIILNKTFCRCTTMIKSNWFMISEYANAVYGAVQSTVFELVTFWFKTTLISALKEV